MAVRTERLAAGRVSTVGTTTIYTVPAGKTTIVKDIALFNLNTSNDNNVGILMDLGAFDKTVIWEELLLSRNGRYLPVWWVLSPGVEIALNLSGAFGVNYLVSGTELAGVSS